MAIAILVVKSVFSEKMKKWVVDEKMGGYPFLVLDSTYYPYLALF